MKLRAVFVALVAALAISTVAHAVSTPQEIKCQQKKLRKLGRYANCIHIALANALKKGNLALFGPALTACQSTFSTAWTLQETNAADAGEECLDGTDTALEFRGRVDDLFDLQGRLLAGQRWKNNSDGTATDLTTGLTWELKTDDGTVHDKDNTYSWAASGSAPSGGAFTQFLGTLNLGTAVTDGPTTGCFAGHCDWRLPTLEELRGIRDASCSNAACTSIPGIAESDYFWTLTTDPNDATFAWTFLLDADATPFTLGKTAAQKVRAVRGGS